MPTTEELERRLDDQERKMEDLYQQLRDLKHSMTDATIQVKGVFNQNQQLSEELAQVLLALKGNPLNKEKGIVDRLIFIEEFIDWFKTKKAVGSGYIFGISAIIGVIVTIALVMKWILDVYKQIKP